jgi:phage shock protein PspC (stress-responsive transcriptional regulator)
MRFVIKLVIICIIFMFVASFIFPPQYKGTAYTDKGGKRYYHLVHLPEQGVVAGVCAGMAYKWGIDPWLPRIGFIAFTCAGGAGVLAYLLLWFFTDSAHTPNDFLERTGG